MKLKLFFGFCMVLLAANHLMGQGKTAEDIEVKFLVTDFERMPIKGAYIYVDSAKTRKKTNKKGLLTIEIDPDTKWITVHSPEHGALSKGYTQQNEMLFQFPKETTPLAEADMAALGFDTKIKARGNSLNYSDYATVYEILNAKFNNVIVQGRRIIIGKGANNFSGNKDPLILVNGQPMTDVSSIPTSEIKLIRVISKGSETAQYGLRGTNGVILIDLK